MKNNRFSDKKKHTQHIFSPHSYKQFTYCHVCCKLLKGLVNQGYQCSGCKINVHRACQKEALVNFVCFKSSESHEKLIPSDSSQEEAPIAHTFSPATFTTPTNCTVCNSQMLLKQGMKCNQCGVSVHRKCHPELGTGCASSSPHKRKNSSSTARRIWGGVVTSLIGDGSSSQQPSPREMEISNPTNFRHISHGTFDHATARLKGVPQDWQEQTDLLFGGSIRSQPRTRLAGYDERIPTALVLLGRELLLSGGLETEGVFRVPPMAEDLRRVRAMLNHGEGMPGRGSTRLSGVGADPLLFASLIKDWFRSLPPGEYTLNPLKGRVLEHAPTGAGEEADRFFERLLLGRGEGAAWLPQPNRSTFLWLVDLAAEVARHEGANKMSPEALAVVFSPSLAETPATNPSEAMQHIQLVKNLISGAIQYVLRHPAPGRDTLGRRERGEVPAPPEVPPPPVDTPTVGEAKEFFGEARAWQGVANAAPGSREGLGGMNESGQEEGTFVENRDCLRAGQGSSLDSTREDAFSMQAVGRHLDSMAAREGNTGEATHVQRTSETVEGNPLSLGDPTAQEVSQEHAFPEKECEDVLGEEVFPDPQYVDEQEPFPDHYEGDVHQDFPDDYEGDAQQAFPDDYEGDAQQAFPDDYEGDVQQALPDDYEGDVQQVNLHIPQGNEESMFPDHHGVDEHNIFPDHHGSDEFPEHHVEDGDAQNTFPDKTDDHECRIYETSRNGNEQNILLGKVEVAFPDHFTGEEPPGHVCTANPQNCVENPIPYNAKFSDGSNTSNEAQSGELSSGLSQNSNVSDETASLQDTLSDSSESPDAEPYCEVQESTWNAGIGESTAGAGSVSPGRRSQCSTGEAAIDMVSQGVPNGPNANGDKLLTNSSADITGGRAEPGTMSPISLEDDGMILEEKILEDSSRYSNRETTDPFEPPATGFGGDEQLPPRCQVECDSPSFQSGQNTSENLQEVGINLKETFSSGLSSNKLAFERPGTLPVPPSTNQHQDKLTFGSRGEVAMGSICTETCAADPSQGLGHLVGEQEATHTLPGSGNITSERLSETNSAKIGSTEEQSEPKSQNESPRSNNPFDQHLEYQNDEDKVAEETFAEARRSSNPFDFEQEDLVDGYEDWMVK